MAREARHPGSTFHRPEIASSTRCPPATSRLARCVLEEGPCSWAMVPGWVLVKGFPWPWVLATVYRLALPLALLYNSVLVWAWLSMLAWLLRTS